MTYRLLVGAGLAMALLSSPVSLARYSPDMRAQAAGESAKVVNIGYSASSADHMLHLVAMLARPSPVLTPGAPVLTEDGMTVGQIEEVVVHRAIIQAVMSVPNTAVASQEQAITSEPSLILVPATAFDTATGQAVLAIPVEQLSHMERFTP